MKTHKSIFVILSILFFCASGFSQNKKRPNVILIITDDQGHGDLGFNGNPHVKTPVLDKFAKESVRFNNFYVSPVCAPTRSSLMTGRHSLRTGIRDTYNGGAIMASNEITIAEILKQADYKTGIFGKWHLGDNYPSRPSDQGFDESLIHLSGGMGQVGDFTTYFQGNRSYFDPVLWHNNQQQKYDGYCSDIFANEAVDFIESNKDQPFFCYLSFNAPHTPLQVPDKYYEMYKDIDPSTGFDADGKPFPKMSERDKETARKVFAMVSNIDDNIAKLFKKLKELKIEDNTIIIFMTDNGPQQPRYVSGMKGRKGSVFQGGVRVPFYIKSNKLFKGNRDIDMASAHIDILPTLSQLCNVTAPLDRKLDGKSLLPLLNKNKVNWEDRSLFFYWTRRYPERFNNMAVQKEGYKLVGHTDFDADIEKFELYNLDEDPYEQKNLVKTEKKKAITLKKELNKMYEELIKSANLINPQRITIGSVEENPVTLNRNDASGARGIWNQEEIYGKWKVNLQQGNYNIKFKFIKPVKAGGKMYLEAGPVVNQKKNEIADTDIIEMKNVNFSNTQECDIIPFYSIGNKKIFPFWVEFDKVD